MILSVQNEVAFDNDLQQLLDTYNITKDELAEHLGASGAFDTVIKELQATLWKVYEALDEITDNWDSYPDITKNNPYKDVCEIVADLHKCDLF